jgi:hypothetical protein
VKPCTISPLHLGHRFVPALMPVCFIKSSCSRRRAPGLSCHKSRAFSAAQSRHGFCNISACEQLLLKCALRNRGRPLKASLLERRSEFPTIGTHRADLRASRHGYPCINSKSCAALLAPGF